VLKAKLCFAKKRKAEPYRKTTKAEPYAEQLILVESMVDKKCKMDDSILHSLFTQILVF